MNSKGNTLVLFVIFIFLIAMILLVLTDHFLKTQNIVQKCNKIDITAFALTQYKAQTLNTIKTLNEIIINLLRGISILDILKIVFPEFLLMFKWIDKLCKYSIEVMSKINRILVEKFKFAMSSFMIKFGLDYKSLIIPSKNLFYLNLVKLSKDELMKKIISINIKRLDKVFVYVEDENFKKNLQHNFKINFLKLLSKRYQTCDEVNSLIYNGDMLKKPFKVKLIWSKN